MSNNYSTRTFIIPSAQAPNDEYDIIPDSNDTEIYMRIVSIQVLVPPNEATSWRCLTGLRGLFTNRSVDYGVSQPFQDATSNEAL